VQAFTKNEIEFNFLNFYAHDNQNDGTKRLPQINNNQLFHFFGSGFAGLGFSQLNNRSPYSLKRPFHHHNGSAKPENRPHF
jgi:hypothetical protein